MKRNTSSMVDADAHLAAWDHDKKKTYQKRRTFKWNHFIQLAWAHWSTRFTPVFTRQFFQVKTNNCGSEPLEDIEFFLNNTAEIIILQAECMYWIKSWLKLRVRQTRTFLMLRIPYINYLRIIAQYDFDSLKLYWNNNELGIKYTVSWIRTNKKIK